MCTYFLSPYNLFPKVVLMVSSFHSDPRMTAGVSVNDKMSTNPTKSTDILLFDFLKTHSLEKTL